MPGRFRWYVWVNINTVTLKPGERGKLRVDLPSQVMEAIERGARLSCEHGPIIQTSPRHYERMVDLLLDGKRFGTCVLSWDSKPPKEWYRRAWNRLLRRHPAEARMEP